MPGDFFGDFLQQIPFALLINVCLLGAILVGALWFVAYWRPKKRRERALAENPAAGYVTAEQFEASGQSAYDTGLLPDLDMLTENDSPMPQQTPQLSPPLRVPKGMYTVQLANDSLTDATELVTVLRDEDDGRLVVQIGDIAYRSLADAPDAKKQFVKIMKELSEVVNSDDPRPPGDYRQQVGAPISHPEPQSEPDYEPELEQFVPELDEPPLDMLTDMPAASSEPSLRDLLDTPPPPPAPRVARDGTMPGDLPSFKLEDMNAKVSRGGLFGRKKVEYDPIPEIDIGKAIEEYLQYKRRQNNDFEGRRIHVRSAPGGLIRIQVDEHFYDAVDEVEDADVRLYLQETIQEWQQRH